MQMKGEQNTIESMKKIEKDYKLIKIQEKYFLINWLTDWN